MSGTSIVARPRLVLSLAGACSKNDVNADTALIGPDGNESSPARR